MRRLSVIPTLTGRAPPGGRAGLDGSYAAIVSVLADKRLEQLPIVPVNTQLGGTVPQRFEQAIPGSNVSGMHAAEPTATL